uniref:Uncharacterized protein n=1 Tax=Arundo donax TaxID=35708 RepID=A0A0A9GKM7_ARUDO
MLGLRAHHVRVKVSGCCYKVFVSYISYARLYAMFCDVLEAMKYVQHAA